MKQKHHGLQGVLHHFIVSLCLAATLATTMTPTVHAQEGENTQVFLPIVAAGGQPAAAATEPEPDSDIINPSVESLAIDEELRAEHEASLAENEVSAAQANQFQVTVRRSTLTHVANVLRGAQPEIFTGQFNEDNKTDIFVVDRATGQAALGFSHGDGSFAELTLNMGWFHHWVTIGTVEIVPGDYNGDGYTDLALLNRGDGWGSVPVFFSNRNGTFHMENKGADADFLRWLRLPNVRVIPGLFNHTDARTDFALVRVGGPNWNSVPILRSNGDGSFLKYNYDIPAFAHFAWQSNLQLVVGNYNNSQGRQTTDLALVRTGAPTDKLPVATADGARSFFVNERPIDNQLQNLLLASDIDVVAGNFNGNNRTDMALVRRTSGWNVVPVLLTNWNSDYLFQPLQPSAALFAQRAGLSDSPIQVGDFDGDGHDEMAVIYPEQNWYQMAVASYTNNGNFDVYDEVDRTFAMRTEFDDRTMLVGDFNADGRDDIIALDSGPGASTSSYTAFMNPLYFRAQLTLTAMHIQEDYDGGPGNWGEFCIYVNMATPFQSHRILTAFTKEYGRCPLRSFDEVATYSIPNATVEVKDLVPLAYVKIHLREKDSGWDNSADCPRTVGVDLGRHSVTNTSCPGGNRVHYQVTPLGRS